MPISETAKREFAITFLSFVLVQANIQKTKQQASEESEKLEELKDISKTLRGELIKQLFNKDSKFKNCEEATKLRGQLGSIALADQANDFDAICRDFINVLFENESNIKEILNDNLSFFLNASFSENESLRLINFAYAQSGNRVELTTISPNELLKQDLVKSILNLAAIHCNIIQLKAKFPDTQDRTALSLYLSSNPEISDEFFLNTTIISTLMDVIKAELSAIQKNYKSLFLSDEFFALSYRDLTNSILDALTTDNLEDAKAAFSDIVISSFAMLDQSRLTINSDQIEAILTNSREVSEKLIQDIFNETTATVSAQRPLSVKTSDGFDESKFRDQAYLEVSSDGALSSIPTASLRIASQNTLSLSAEEKPTSQTSDAAITVDDINERAQTIIDLLRQYSNIKKSSETTENLKNSIIEEGILENYLSAIDGVDPEQLEAKLIEEIFNKPDFVERIELQTAKEDVEFLISNQSQSLGRLF